MDEINFDSQWLGICDYERALKRQQQLYQESLDNQKTFLLGLEHSPVITVGRRSKIDEELRLGKEKLLSLGWQIVSADRGGQATMHMPGQLVVYPVINLRHFGLGVREYLCLLSKATSRLLHESYQVSSVDSSDDPGLYTENGKICFFGIRVQRGVAYHGLSLNVHNDLTSFKFIRPCGIEERSFDSLKSHSIDASCHNVFTQWAKVFQDELRQRVPEWSKVDCRNRKL